MSFNDEKEQEQEQEDWERQHEYVANALFELAADISRLIVAYYKKSNNNSNNRYKKVKSAIYNEWGITEDMLHITFQWPSDNDNDNDNDIVIVLRNRHHTPYLDIDDDNDSGLCPEALQDTLLQSHIIQRFVHLDEEYGIFVQKYRQMPIKHQM